MVVVKSFLDERGIPKTLQEVSTAVSAADRSFSDDDFIGRDYWKEWNIRILADLGIVSDREGLASYIDSHWFEKAEVSLYTDVLPVLCELKGRGLRMGAVTNGLSTDIPHLVDELGLAEFFEAKVSADTAGRRKPNPRIFLHAATELSLPPSDILFVGDDPDLDYHPSESVGMTPVLVCRGKGCPLVKNLVRDLKGILDFL